MSTPSCRPFPKAHLTGFLLYHLAVDLKHLLRLVHQLSTSRYVSPYRIRESVPALRFLRRGRHVHYDLPQFVGSPGLHQLRQQRHQPPHHRPTRPVRRHQRQLRDATEQLAAQLTPAPPSSGRPRGARSAALPASLELPGRTAPRTRAPALQPCRPWYNTSGTIGRRCCSSGCCFRSRSQILILYFSSRSRNQGSGVDWRRLVLQQHVQPCRRVIGLALNRVQQVRFAVA